MFLLSVVINNLKVDEDHVNGTETGLWCGITTVSMFVISKRMPSTYLPVLPCYCHYCCGLHDALPRQFFGVTLFLIPENKMLSGQFD